MHMLLKGVPIGTQFELVTENGTGNVYLRATSILPTRMAYGAEGDGLLDKILEFNKFLDQGEFCLIVSQSGIVKVAIEIEEVLTAK